MSDFRQLAHDVGAVPLGDLIAAIGRGVAEAQAALDAGSLEQTLALYDQDDELQRTLRELGYRPTFYTIPETEGELKLSLSVSLQHTATEVTTGSPPATPPDAGKSTPGKSTPGKSTPGKATPGDVSSGPRTDLPVGILRSPVTTVLHQGAARVASQTGADARTVSSAAIPRSALGATAPTFRVQSRVYATPVDGRYQNSYSFTSQVSATVKFKIVAIPPSTEAESARVIPNFVGMKYPAAATLAESFDLVLTDLDPDVPTATSVVAAQEPAAGEIVAAGAVVTISVTT